MLERIFVAEALSPACSRARSCSPLRDHPLEQARLAATALRSAGSGSAVRKRPVSTSHLLQISSKTFICQDRLT